MRVIFEEHISNRKRPVNIVNDDIALFEHEFKKNIRNTHLIRVYNGIILKDIIIKLWKNPRKYLTYTLINPNITIKSILKRILFFRRGLNTIEKGVWIIDNWSLGYFHWMTDALPRLLASSRENEIYPVILPENYKQIAYVTESLRLLGVNVIFYNSLIPLRVKKLLITSHTAKSGNYNNTLINELRNKFINVRVGGIKVFISRLKAPKRKITNEHQVAELLKSYGYEIHYFEDYTFSKQIEIMSQTTHLIGLHGAGLTNMLFMREEGKILELRNLNDANNNCYFSLASELNLNYYYQLNQGNNTNTHTVDIIVDIDNLRKNIERME